MSRRILSLFLVPSALVALGTLCSQPAQAQTRNVIGNQGNSNLNSAAQSTLNLGADSLQSTSGQGLGSFTQQAAGAVPGGQQGGFVGRGGNNTGQFVGRGGQAGQARQQQQQQRRNTFSQLGQNRNNSGRNNRSRSRTTGTQRVIRPRLRIAFQYTRPPLNLAVTSLSGRFGRLSSRRPSLANVRFETGADGEITLQGSVSSAETRKLAEIMAGMQPGVRKVRNELTVAEDAAVP